MVWPNAGSQIFLIHPDKPRITSCAAPRQIKNNKKGLLEFRMMGEVRPELVGVVEMGHFPPPQPSAQVKLGGEGEKKIPLNESNTDY